MAYPELEKELKARSLLYDEIRMWLRLGFYISGEPRRILNARQTGHIDAVVMLDGMANKVDLEATIGKNIRLGVLAWWEVERVKPRAKEVIDNTGLSELENRNAV